MINFDIDKLRDHNQKVNGLGLVGKEQEILFSLTKMRKFISKRDNSVAVLIKGKATWSNIDGSISDGGVDGFIQEEKQLKTESFKDINAVGLGYAETMNADSVKGEFIVKSLIVEKEAEGKDGKTYKNKKLVKITSITKAPESSSASRGIDGDEKGGEANE